MAGKENYDISTSGLTDLRSASELLPNRKRGGRFYPVREAPSELNSSNARYSGYWRSLGAKGTIKRLMVIGGNGVSRTHCFMLPKHVD